MSGSAPARRASRLAPNLDNRLEGEVFDDALHRCVYSTDASIYRVVPSLVAHPATTADVAAAVGFASERGMPVTARGAATGVAGECLTSGLVLDMSVHLTDVTVSGDGKATAAAGAVLNDLNAIARTNGECFGPDPSSANRATIGGCLANNATGAHSPRYGYTADHVRWIRAVLADGSEVVFHRDGLIEGRSSIADRIRGTIPGLLADWAQQIDSSWPASPRNRAGYAVKGTLRNGLVDWVRLLCGSEGTLAIFVEAQLSLVRVPLYKCVVQVTFDSLDAMARTVGTISRCRCSSCELIDSTLAGICRTAFPQHANLFPDAAASLAIEIEEDSDAALRQSADGLLKALRNMGLARQTVLLTDPAHYEALLAIRRKAVPLLYRRKDSLHPIPAIEDISVPAEFLPDYISGLQELAASEGVHLAFFGHAADGELHVRPFLDLRKDADRQVLRRLTLKTSELAWRLSGTVSGEHGCGLSRSWLLRSQYGPCYELFRQIKHVFDPHNILNPGKIVTDGHDAAELTRHLRYDEKPSTLPLAQDPLQPAEACNGCGTCRSREPASRMCPVFRATGKEPLSPRAKSVLLRSGARKTFSEHDRADLGRLLALCIGCRSCQSECPSGIDTARLVAHAKSALGTDGCGFAARHGLAISQLGSIFAPLANAVIRTTPVRWTIERLLGIDRTAPLPSFAWGSVLPRLRKYAAKHNPSNPVERVCYYVDQYACYHDHELAFAVVDLLLHLGTEVIIPPQTPSGMPLLANGYFQEALPGVRRNIEGLLPLVRQGYKVICSEPTAALCITSDWPDITGDPAAHEVARSTFELTEYLVKMDQRGLLRHDMRPMDMAVAYHTPCHLRAKHGSRASQLLKLIPGVSVRSLPESCCGLAGTWGLSNKNSQLSAAIASTLKAAIRPEDEALSSECSFCNLQLSKLSSMRSLHPAIILANAYGIRRAPGRESCRPIRASADTINGSTA